MAPSKPTNVDIEKLKKVLADLQALEYDVTNPPPRSFTQLQSTISGFLQDGQGHGLQENGAYVADKRYDDATTRVTQGWTDMKSGVTALVKMVSDTISHHEGADKNAQDGANQTNTTQQPSSMAGAN